METDSSNLVPHHRAQAPSLDIGPSAPIRTDQYDEVDDEDDLVYASAPAPVRPRHQVTPSQDALLPARHLESFDLPGSAVPPVIAERQKSLRERLQSYRLEVDEATPLARAWRKLAAIVQVNQGFLLIVLSQFFMASINTYLSLSDATSISFLSPVVVGLLATVLLRESYSRVEALSGLASLGGVVLIAKPSFIFRGHTSGETGADGLPITPEQRSVAVLVAMGGVLGSAGAYLTIRKIGTRANALHSMSYFALYSVIVASAYPFFVHSPPVLFFEKHFLLLIVPIGIFGFLGQTLLTVGLQREKAGRGTLGVYANLLFALVFERLVFEKLPDWWSLTGAMIIVGGAGWVVVSKKATQPAEVGEGDESKAEEGRMSLERLSRSGQDSESENK
ncbi:hypothetical protein MNV49_000008 [Pseudohyphozyma bogoriensis]|nr:hypothetical protein MNV49_000008 [Pseudohyphozyma bogoriensis]